MTAPERADNEAIRAGIIDGSINPAPVNVRKLLAEVVDERDRLRAAVAEVRNVADSYRPSKVIAEKFYTAAVDKALGA